MDACDLHLWCRQAKNAQKIVLVGDPKQLRPIVTCTAAEQMGLNISLLEPHPYSN